jgi:ankyrin repeat protein
VSDELSDAVERGDIERARELLAAGASPHEDDWGMPILDEAIERSDERMVRLLVEHGASLNAIETDGRTRLHAAAASADDPDLVGFLVRVGLDLDAVDYDGWTPLHFAAANGYRRVAAVLLQAGGDTSAPTRAGQLAIDLARLNGHADWP